MITLSKLITGEFVIGKKNEKEKVIEKPFLVIPTSKGAMIIEYYSGLSKKPLPIPFHCIMIPDIEPLQGMTDQYSNLIHPLSVPKKKLIDLTTHRNNLN